MLLAGAKNPQTLIWANPRKILHLIGQLVCFAVTVLVSTKVHLFPLEDLFTENNRVRPETASL